MRVHICVLSSLLTALISLAQPPTSLLKPHGWYPGDNNSADLVIGVDTGTFHSGKASVFVNRLPSEDYGFGSIRQVFCAEDYRCKRILISAFLKARDLERGLLTIHCQGSGYLVGGNMSLTEDNIEETFEWKQIRLAIEVPPETQFIELIVQLIGQGTIWADDFKIEILDNPGEIKPRNLITEQGKKIKNSPRKFLPNKNMLNSGFEEWVRTT